MYAFKRSFLAVASISASLLALGAQALWAEPKYIITDVGLLSTQSVTPPKFLNDNGQLVGSNSIRELLYNNSALTAISLPGETAYGIGVINNLGQAAFSSSPDQNYLYAYFYSNGTTVRLNALGGNRTSVTGINASGQIIGYGTTPTSAIAKPFVISNGTTTQLPDALININDINASGQIVGITASQPLTNETHYQPVLYSQGTITNLNTIGAEQGFAYALNDSGAVVGTIGFPYGILLDLSATRICWRVVATMISP